MRYHINMSNKQQRSNTMTRNSNSNSNSNSKLAATIRRAARARGATKTAVCHELTIKGVRKPTGAVGTWYPKELTRIMVQLGVAMPAGWHDPRVDAARKAAQRTTRRIGRMTGRGAWELLVSAVADELRKAQ